MRPISLIDQHNYGCEVPPCSRKELVEHAHAIHQTLGYKGDKPFPIVEFAEQILYFFIEDYCFDVAPESEMGDELGKTWPDKHLIKIREDVYVAAVEGQGFARMTIAHECGHLLRHRGIPVSMARRAATRQLPAFRSSEWQANAMAGAIMMPSCKIVDMSVDEIVDRYQVSTSAASTQLDAIRKEAKKWSMPLL